ncbi:MAG: bifunctional pyr operon transcriptional regulator/uracil phosphoribosyltransferase PyrR [Candidatus Dadabacteria bacterium]|nr:MAG: bifunctional pyr operon transcriptional regulator/uracil phosphoribosyltransferase PyrR [Candidatus Dadabacteria bacterium]
MKEVPKEWKCVCDEIAIRKALTRVAYQICEKTEDISNFAIVGIKTAGEFIGERIRKKIEEIEGKSIHYGVLDITLYRDDLNTALSQPVLKGTDLPFAITGSRIVLVDDVLYTGRTIRAALDAIIDFGRPAKVELAVLVDRGHRELPIRADYVGKNIPTNKNEFVKVRLKEMGYKTDGVYIVPRAYN